MSAERKKALVYALTGIIFAVLVALPNTAGAQEPNIYSVLESQRLTPELLASIEQGVIQFYPDPDDVAVLTSQLAQWLEENNRFDEAIDLYEYFIGYFRRTLPPNHVNTLWLMTSLAEVHKDTGNIGLSLRLHLEALELQIKTLGIGNEITYLNLIQTADILVQLSRFDEAIVLMYQAVEGSRKTLSPENTVKVLAKLRVFLVEAARLSEANEISQQIAQATGQLLSDQRPIALAETLSISTRLLEAVQPVEAEKILRRALEQLASSGQSFDKDWFDIQTLLIRSLLRQNRAEEALALVVQNLRFASETAGVESQLMLDALEQMSKVLQASGRLDENERVVDERLRIASALLGPTDLVTLEIETEKVKFLISKQQFSEALVIAGRVQDAYEKIYGADHFKTLSARVIYNMVLGNLVPFEQADASWQGLIDQLNRELGPRHPITDSALNGYDLFLLLNGKFVSEVAQIERSGRRTDAFGKEYKVAITQLEFRAMSSFDQQNPFKSLDLFRQVLAAKIARLRSAGAFESDPDIAVNAISLNRTIFFNLLTSLLASNKPPDEIRRNGETRDGLLNQAFQTTQLAFLDRTSQAVQRSMVRKNSAKFGLQDSFRDWANAQDEVTILTTRIAAISAGISGDESGDIGALSDRLTGLKTDIETIENLFDRDFPGFSALVGADTVTLDDLRSGPRPMLGPDDALVVIATDVESDEPVSTIWVVTRETLGWSFIKPHSDLEPMVARFRAMLDRPALPGLVASRAPVALGQETSQRPTGGMYSFGLGFANELYQELFGSPEIAPVLAQKSNWIIVPRGSLLSLPFAALVDEKPAQEIATTPQHLRAASWLGRNRNLTILPSVASLRSLAVKRDADPRRLAYFGIGDPAFSGVQAPLRGIEQRDFAAASDRLSAVRSLPRLPGTFEEIARLSASFPNNAQQTLIGENATETRIAALDADGTLGSSNIVHFATHGLLAGGLAGLDEPALALTPPSDMPRQLPNGSIDDGLLTSTEIARLSLNADWVILSACNTAAGNSMNARGLSGLARAFFYAGARSLLVTHWSVRDDVAARLISETVTAGAQNMAPAQALRLAMTRMIDDPSQDMNAFPLSHPALWAPFQIIGPPR